MRKILLAVVALVAAVAVRPWLLLSAVEPSRDLSTYALFARNGL